MTDRPAPAATARPETGPVPRVLVLGANGPTGRRTVQQALDRGLHVDALTRQPTGFPLQHERLQVIGGDATDADVIDGAVSAADAVISVIGAAFTRQPVTVYSTSAEHVVAAMRRHRKGRLVVVTSTGLTPTNQRTEVSRFEQVFAPLARNTFGRTVYDDMARMETTVTASNLDWTIVRPPGLTDEPGTGYATAGTWIDGPYCARDDLATMLLDQLDNHQYLHTIAAVTTPGLHVGTWQTLRRELLKR